MGEEEEIKGEQKQKEGEGVYVTGMKAALTRK